jgi:hypothetical protein
MRLFVAMLFSIGLVVGAGVGPSRATGFCGVGCHVAIYGGCVVDGWESGAPVWNECPAGAHPRPPCGKYYSWRKHSKTCMRVN